MEQSAILYLRRDKIEPAEVQWCPVEDTVAIVHWSNCVGQHEGIIWHKGRRRLRSIKGFCLISVMRCDDLPSSPPESCGVFSSFSWMCCGSVTDSFRSRRRGLISDMMFWDGYARTFNGTEKQSKSSGSQMSSPHRAVNTTLQCSWASAWSF